MDISRMKDVFISLQGSDKEMLNQQKLPEVTFDICTMKLIKVILKLHPFSHELTISEITG